MMKRRTLLAGVPAVAFLPATPIALATGPILGVPERTEPLTGMPLAAHHGKLAGEALVACEFSHHFDMLVRNGEVWFHNRHDPREVIAHHIRMIVKEAAKLPPGPIPLDRAEAVMGWLFEVEA